MAHLAATAAPGITRAVFLKQKATRKCHCPLCLRPCRRKSTHTVCHCDRDHRWPSSAFCRQRKGFNDTRANILAPTPPLTPDDSSDGGDADSIGDGNEGAERLHYPDQRRPHAMRDLVHGAPLEEEVDNIHPPEDGSAKYCPACYMWVNGPTQWVDHLIGKKHKKNVRRMRRIGV